MRESNYPDGNSSDMVNVVAYSLAQTLVRVFAIMRRRSDARERHAPGHKSPQFRAADAAAGHQDPTAPNDYALIRSFG